MSKFSFFSDLVNTLFDKKNRKKNFSSLFEKKQNKSLFEYIENVNDAKSTDVTANVYKSKNQQSNQETEYEECLSCQ